MNKSSISFLALMIALGSSDDLHADARSVLSKLNLGNTSSSSNTSQNETKLKEQISQLKADVSTLHKL